MQAINSVFNDIDAVPQGDIVHDINMSTSMILQLVATLLNTASYESYKIILLDALHTRCKVNLTGALSQTKRMMNFFSIDQTRHDAETIYEVIGEPAIPQDNIFDIDSESSRARSARWRKIQQSLWQRLKGSGNTSIRTLYRQRRRPRISNGTRPPLRRNWSLRHHSQRTPRFVDLHHQVNINNLANTIPS
jgi:hypothetical protein